MSVTIERLVQLLEAARDVDEWIAMETRITLVARSTGARPARAGGQSVSLGAVVHRDSERGRGVATLWLDGEAGDEDHARRLIARTAERASLALGPAWTLPAPAAPAHVAVVDPDIAADAGGVVDGAIAQLGQLRAASGRQTTVASARIAAERRSHRVETSRGFSSQYESTAVSYQLAVGPVGPVGPVGAAAGRADLEEVSGRVRSAAQLALPRRVAEAARAASQRAAARPLQPGRYDLLLRPSAVVAPATRLHPPARAVDYGLFAPLVAHASAEWVRLGISRYQPGQPVFAAGDHRDGSRDASGRVRPPPGGEVRRPAATAPGGDRPADAFTLASDGTIPFAPLSAPFGDLGEPVRRFDLVRDGTAAGLALDYREAALARAAPNGGVRNLVLAPGGTPAADLARSDGQRPLLDIAELSWLDVDPRSGRLTAGIRLARLRGVPVASGVLVGDAFDLLGRARLSTETGTLAWFRGPIAIRIDGADVIG